jgi:hypothetical protein
MELLALTASILFPAPASLAIQEPFVRPTSMSVLPILAKMVLLALTL